MSKRLFDLAVAVTALPLLLLPMMLVAAAVRLTSRGPALYWSERVGQGGRRFRMPKFRTMQVGTPLLATDQLVDPARYLTPIGGWLRRTSLDELPQLWSVLTGDMSLVGPRPALASQTQLLAMRGRLGINALVPGLTGWAQVNGRDDISDDEKVRLEAEYLDRRGWVFDLRILLATLHKVIEQDGIKH